MQRRSGHTGPVPPRGPRDKINRVVKRSSRLRTRTWPTDILHTVPEGLANTQGVYCYRRATMQCLLHLPVMYNHLGMIHASHRGPIDRCVVCSLQSLWQRYWNEKERESFPATAVGRHDAAVQHIGPNGTGFEDSRTLNQGDSWEYLDYLRHVMSSLNNNKDNARTDRMLIMRQPRRWWCPTCNQQFTDQDDGMGLKLSVAHNHANQLPVMIQNDYNDTIQYRCNSAQCQALGQQQCTRQRRITQAPEVLIIHLNRLHIRMTPHGAQLFKTRPPVNYPLNNLDLSAYTATGTQLNYQLYGVVAHQGGPQGGHYIASVRERAGQQFRTIDDQTVHNPFPQPLTGFPDFDPTILFYLKQ